MAYLKMMFLFPFGGICIHSLEGISFGASLTMFRLNTTAFGGLLPLGQLSQADEIAKNALISTFEKAVTWQSEKCRPSDLWEKADIVSLTVDL